MSNTTGYSEGENCRYVIVEIGAVVHDEKSNQWVATEVAIVFSLNDRKYVS